VEKEAESLFEEELSKLSGPNFSLEISSDEACVALRVWDNHHEPVAQRKLPVA
jgi:hypothetical protein